MDAAVRQARLKPEFAHLYPGITAGEWVMAASMALRVAALRRRQGGLPGAGGDRVLYHEHFEFRGMGPEPAELARSRPRMRITGDG